MKRFYWSTVKDPVYYAGKHLTVSRGSKPGTYVVQAVSSVWGRKPRTIAEQSNLADAVKLAKQYARSNDYTRIVALGSHLRLRTRRVYSE